MYNTQGYTCEHRACPHIDYEVFRPPPPASNGQQLLAPPRCRISGDFGPDGDFNLFGPHFLYFRLKEKGQIKVPIACGNSDPCPTMFL